MSDSSIPSARIIAYLIPNWWLDKAMDTKATIVGQQQNWDQSGAIYSFSYTDAITGQTKTASMPVLQGKTNAFAHAFSTAKILIEESELLSKEIGDWREAKSVRERPNTWQTYLDNYADLYNNALGIQIGRYAREKNLTIDEVEALVIATINDGQTINRYDDPRIPKNFSGKPSDFNPNVAVWSSKLPPLPTPPKCFLAGTKIAMADGSIQTIENIKTGDIVASYYQNKNGESKDLVGRRVKQRFINLTKEIIDLRGLLCTPGHLFLSSMGKENELQFKTISSILKEDGCVIDKNGRHIRARTGACIDSFEDIIVGLNIKEKSGAASYIKVRSGIPIQIHNLSSDRNDDQINQKYISLYEFSLSRGVVIDRNGVFHNGQSFDFIDWPPNCNPLDHIITQNWVVESANGEFYTPDWISNLSEQDFTESMHIIA